ncbi:MAG: hypothetical protein GY898_08495 [Proteobacteria bacterium]|nr:hypothetical protein [Pseudomonadota bacterium]
MTSNNTSAADGQPTIWAFDNPFLLEGLGIGDGSALDLADVDGDGDLDLAAGWRGGSRAVLLRSIVDLGYATPEVAWTAPFEEPVEDLAFVDLDADGDMDLAAVGGPLRVYENVDGALQQGTLWPAVGTSGSALAVGDRNGDGRLELAVAFGAGGGDLYESIDGTFQRTWKWPNDQVLPPDLAWADVDRNGTPDLAAATGGGVQLCLSNAGGTPGLTDHPTRIVVLPSHDEAVAGEGHGSLGTAVGEHHRVRYLLIDPESDPVPRVSYQVSIDDGATWQNGGMNTHTPGITNLSSSPEGVEHDFGWIWLAAGTHHRARLRVIAEGLDSRTVAGLPQHAQAAGISPAFRLDGGCFPPAFGKDEDGDGFTPCDEIPDCNVGEAEVYPGASELCDGRDNDCDGAIPASEIDADEDGELDCVGACDETATNGAFRFAEAETCDDGIDSDCDGAGGPDAGEDPECWDEGCSCSSSGGGSASWAGGARGAAQRPASEGQAEHSRIVHSSSAPPTSMDWPTRPQPGSKYCSPMRSPSSNTWIPRLSTSRSPPS